VRSDGEDFDFGETLLRHGDVCSFCGFLVYEQILCVWCCEWLCEMKMNGRVYKESDGR